MTMTFNEFHNALRILLNIDMDQMEKVGIVFGDECDQPGTRNYVYDRKNCVMRNELAWEKFRDNPHRWFIQASDQDATRVWKIIQERQRDRFLGACP